MSGISFLKDVREELRERLNTGEGSSKHYTVPSLWLARQSGRGKSTRIPPSSFLCDALEYVTGQRTGRIIKTHGGSWTRDAVIYNMFVRTTCAFDHNQNGILDLPVNQEGWRETGTFMKAAAMLPYIKSIGTNTLHLLPITSIGSDGNKGTLGSPYAIKNPYKIDENLSEPNVGFGPDKEFKVFVQSAHHLGLRVVVEFVFRTSAKDGDWVKDHPEWFYWIRNEIRDREPGSLDESRYGNPVFTSEELETILASVDAGKLSDLCPPHEVYRAMFSRPPSMEQVEKVHGRYIGTLEDGLKIRIPGAFADWPPQDTQPPWGDVTYFKMYDHRDFNYIAYNTLRMYDQRLAQPQNVNKPLWETIAEIIPHYQNEFGIDGVMIDMGHALPNDLKHEMIRRARSIDPDFAFWDENFSVTQKSIQEGYNAVIGYQWSDQHRPEKFREMLKRFSGEGFPIPFFATAESHNTPRAAAREGGGTYSRYAWALSNFIPAVPFIHSGFELGETFPINTGLDFTKEDLAGYPSENLPLFSEHAYDWSKSQDLIQWIKRVTSVRRKYHEIITNPSASAFHWIETPHPDLIAFARGSDNGKPYLLLLANSNMHNPLRCDLDMQIRKHKIKDLLSEAYVMVNHGVLEVKLSAGQVSVMQL